MSDGRWERVMARPPHKKRYRATPSSIEVNVRAIRPLQPDGWKLWSLEEFPIVGTVPKNYLSYGDPYKPRTCGYIAKKGRTKDDARECITEEIISKIGAMLPLVMARSKLARLSKKDVRFLSQNFVVRGQHELLHGIELVARYFETNPREVETAFNLTDKKAEKTLYSIDNILIILAALFPKDAVSLRDGFFKMLAFDAFIGAPDRHAMNWGVLASLTTKSVPARFAPIFDTARGLFREYSDADLLLSDNRQGRKQFLTNYAEKSCPILSTGEATQKKQNHFALVKSIVSNADDKGHEAMRTVFNAVDLCSIEHMLQRNFRRVITQYRIEFIRDLLLLRIQRIRKELQQ